MIGPPKGIEGICTGTEPLARITCSAVIVTGPVAAFSNEQVLPSVNFAQPLTTRTLARFKRPVTPVLRRFTIVSFHFTVSAKSIVGGLASLTPWRDFAAAWRMVSNSPATWMIALDGMQPRM